MIKKAFVYLLVIFAVLILFEACSSNTDKYVLYLDGVVSVLENNKIEASKKGTEILAYVEKNKADIEKTLSTLKALSLRDTETVVDKVRTKVNSVLDTVQALSQSAPEIAEDPNLIKALQTLKVIGE